jgi:branched-chain amino acid transport system ATP-binding protein
MIIEVEEVSRSFGGIRAVDGVSFSLDEGATLGVVGANGSGKTTMLNLLTRVLDAESGRMVFEGREYSKVAPHRVAHMGMTRTFQNLRMFNDLTMMESILLGARAGGERASTENVDRLIDLVGLGYAKDMLPKSLPYGSQRLIEIVRALAPVPKVLFLDEPFAGMSVDEATAVTDLLRSEQERAGVSVVIVDHNTEVMTQYVDRMMVMSEGRVIAAGSPHGVLKEPEVVASYMGVDNG